MSEKTFTPGPWQTMPEEHDKQYVRIRGTQLGERYKIANVLAPDYEGANELEADETRANARLIAAAPELLEALQELVRPYGVSDTGIVNAPATLQMEFIASVRAAKDAIAKATGAA
jgi:hypothetical protein